MSKNIFRQSALQELSSPDQLDQNLRITTPLNWLALAACLLLLVAALVWGFYGQLPTQVEGQGILLSPGGIKAVTAGADGQVVDFYVQAGDFIQAGQVIARLLPTGQTLSLSVASPYTGHIIEVQVDVGGRVSLGTTLALVEGGHVRASSQPGAAPDEQLIVYVSPTDGKRIAPGMRVQISPSTVKREEYGLMLGQVATVGEFPATALGMLRTLGNEKLVASLSAGGASIETRIDLVRNPATASGYQWTSPGGPPIEIQNGTPVAVWITVREQRPISLIFPMIK